MSNPTTLDDIGGGFVSDRILMMMGEYVAACVAVLQRRWRSERDRRGWSCKMDQTALISFLDFFDPGGRFAFTNHHRSGFCLSDGYSCHGCAEEVSLQENVPKSVPPFSGVIPSWVHVFSNSTAISSCRTQAGSITLFGGCIVLLN